MVLKQSSMQAMANQLVKEHIPVKPLLSQRGKSMYRTQHASAIFKGGWHVLFRGHSWYTTSRARKGDRGGNPVWGTGNPAKRKCACQHDSGKIYRCTIV